MLGEAVVKFLAIVIAGSLGAAAITDEEYSRFPKLYHLDDFEDCLLRKNGLYCVGTFHLKPLHAPDPTYELMKEYSSDPHNFNRTLIHRGDCVSLRCPSLSDRNASRRFERCTSLRARRYNMSASLIQLSYCRSHTQDIALKDYRSSAGTPHRVFLYVVGAIMILNLIGTAYDVTVRNDGKKSRLLTSWSLVSNWPQLAGPYPDGDPRLAALLPIEGFRVIVILLVVFVHTGCFHDMLFLQNPKFVEEMSHHPALMPLQNGSCVIQIFIMTSNFLLAQSLLSMNQPPSFWILPKLILKRIFRIAPVYLLVISFAATWWPLMRDGPMWPMLVTAESEVCKRKFWANLFFLQNFVEPARYCQVQTWFLAVDMQLYVVGCIITLCLARARRHALPLLGTAFIATCILNSCRAYINEWKPFMFISVPKSCSAVCGCGQFGPKKKRLIIACQMLVPLMLAWTSSGHLVRHFTSQEFMALYIALERPVIIVLAAAVLFGIYNGIGKKDMKKNANAVIVSKDKNMSTAPTKGFLKYMFSWRIWYPLGRMSLSVLMLHWCVTSLIVASRLTPVTSTALDLVTDWIATFFLTYLLAVPVTLMVEIPFQKFYSALISL